MHFFVTHVVVPYTKLPGDFADIQVRNCFGPYHFGVVPLVVFGHGLARVPSDLLPILSGYLIQMNRPGFSRHLASSLRNVFQTLPVTADC